jgi:hypothetical protein
VRKRLKTKEGDFDDRGFFDDQCSSRRAWLGREQAAKGGNAFARRQVSGTEWAEDQESCGSVTQNLFACQLINYRVLIRMLYRERSNDFGGGGFEWRARSNGGVVEAFLTTTRMPESTAEQIKGKNPALACGEYRPP